MRTCTRRIEWDAAHRVMRHESKCAHLHGHRYVAEVTVAAPELDSLGRVIDFSVVKEIVGYWVDREWDHGTMLCAEDYELQELCAKNGWKHYLFDTRNPTAENIAKELFDSATLLLQHVHVTVTHVRIYETPNCWADYAGGA